MGTSANPVGRWVLLGALIITALMIAYYAVSKNGQVAFGISIVALATAAFVYLFYARMNTVQRTGWMSMLFLILVAVMLPFFYLAQNQVANTRTHAQYDNQLRYAAGLFTTYCATCHGLLGQGIAGPQLNNALQYQPNGNPGIAQLQPSNINAIITAGILNSSDTSLKNYYMPAWSQSYGGPLNDDDINALTALVVSGTPALQTKVGVPDNTNGFDFVPNYLTTPALQSAYQSQLQALKNPTGPTADLTSEKAVTVPIINTPTNPASAYGFIYTDKQGKTYTSIQIKVGTTVTWTNNSSVLHTIVQGTPSAPETSPIFGAPNGVNVGVSYSYTFTKAGTYPYYCSVHPSMLAQIIVVA